jgi:hypothetical protein
MKRSELEHVLRAASAITLQREFIVIGSQAILGEHPDPPPELLVSMEVDIFPRRRPQDSVLIDGAIGEGSVFHETFGYYAHGVGPDTARLPEGWESRLVPLCNENTQGATGWCLETHDLAVSKLVAGRPRDLEFILGLLQHGMVLPEVLQERVAAGPLSGEEQTLCFGRLSRLSGK